MAAIRVFLDTDILINWLAKETKVETGKALWKASYQILKKIEAGKLAGYITLVNLMELIFVLRRKKRWSEEQISVAIGKLQRLPHLTVLVPTDADLIAAYNLQRLFPLGPFDALYYAIVRSAADFLISRDQALLAAVNKAERKQIALSEALSQLVCQTVGASFLGSGSLKRNGSPGIVNYHAESREKSVANHSIEVPNGLF